MLFVCMCASEEVASRERKKGRDGNDLVRNVSRKKEMVIYICNHRIDETYISEEAYA